MNVNGLQSLFGNYYGNSRISSMYRNQFQNVVQGINRSSASNRSNVTRSMDRSSREFLNTYNRSMSDLMSSANVLRSMNNSGIWNKTTVKSSDKTMLNVVQNYRMSSRDTFQVNVKQLAAKQTNTSAGIMKNDLAQKDAAFSISTEKGAFSFKVDAKDKDGNFKTNTQMLNEMADAVNKSGIGVKASVSTEDDTAKITFTSEKTGEKSAFEVKGEAAEEYGFDKVSQEAQDAEYTVSKNGRQEETFTSAENTVTMDYGRMDVTFEKTGQATIQTGQMDDDAIVAAVKDLVEKNNSTISLLEKNVSRGYGVERQLNGMTNGSFSDHYVEDVGIKRADDGRLSLDEEKLRASLETNPDEVKEVLGSSYGLGQTAFDDARQGLAQTSMSLLDNEDRMFGNSYNSYDRYSSDFNYFSDFTNSFQMMGLYNRLGSNTMSNVFSIGNFIDMFF